MKKQLELKSIIRDLSIIKDGETIQDAANDMKRITSEIDNISNESRIIIPLWRKGEHSNLADRRQCSHDIHWHVLYTW